MKVCDQRLVDSELDLRLQRFLLTYRLTPHGTTGRAPAEALMNRRPVSVLDRMRPDLRRKVTLSEQVSNQKKLNSGCDSDFKINDRVFAKFFNTRRRWRPGVIVNVAGPLSYDVQVADEVHCRHASQLFQNRGTTRGFEKK